MDKNERELQSVTDLVAFQVMAKIFLHHAAQEEQNEEEEEDGIASHQSDDGMTNMMAEHHSDSGDTPKIWGLTVPLAWKLAQLWQRYKWWTKND